MTKYREYPVDQWIRDEFTIKGIGVTHSDVIRHYVPVMPKGSIELITGGDYCPMAKSFDQL